MRLNCTTDTDFETASPMLVFTNTANGNTVTMKVSTLARIASENGRDKAADLMVELVTSSLTELAESEVNFIKQQVAAALPA